MRLSNSKRQSVTASFKRLGWLSLIAGLGANVLLFYVLALARTKPSLARPDERDMARIISLDLPIQSEAEPAGKDLAPELAPVVLRPTPAVFFQPIPDAVAAFGPRLSDWISEFSRDLPCLPVALPGSSDLKPTQPAFVSGLRKPLSILRVDRIPSKISGSPPRYPRWARRAGLEGAVTLRFVVTADGTVRNIRIHHIEGDERFGYDAASAIAKWRFNPAIKAGKPVACWCFQKVSFRLSK